MQWELLRLGRLGQLLISSGRPHWAVLGYACGWQQLGEAGTPTEGLDGRVWSCVSSLARG